MSHSRTQFYFSQQVAATCNVVANCWGHVVQCNTPLATCLAIFTWALWDKLLRKLHSVTAPYRGEWMKSRRRRKIGSASAGNLGLYFLLRRLAFIYRPLVDSFYTPFSTTTQSNLVSFSASFVITPRTIRTDLEHNLYQFESGIWRTYYMETRKGCW